MPLFYFNLRTIMELIPDPDGTELPDEAAAREHAAAVACELMRNTKEGTRSWRMEVCDRERRPAFNLMFVEVDGTLAHLAPELRDTVVKGCTRAASLRDTIQELQRTLFQVRGTIARAEGAPYVAAVGGVRL